MSRRSSASLALACVVVVGAATGVATPAHACGHTGALVGDDASADVEEAEALLDDDQWVDAAEAASRALRNDLITPRDQWRASRVIALGTIASGGTLGTTIDGTFTLYRQGSMAWRHKRLTKAEATLTRIQSHAAFGHDARIASARRQASILLASSSPSPSPSPSSPSSPAWTAALGAGAIGR